MTELHSLSMLALERARQEAERRHIAEYSESQDPDRRLRAAIYEILAVTAASVLDREPQEFEQAQQRPGWMGAWPPRAISKVQERMENDPLFHRLVQMQAKLVWEEIEIFHQATCYETRIGHVKEEREACARVADSKIAKNDYSDNAEAYSNAARDIAELIRERSI